MYICNRAAHVVDVFDAHGRRLFSFGGFGCGPGQFNDPADVAIVPLTPRHAYGRWPRTALAVADRGNHRVQLFSLEGELLRVVDPWLNRGRRVEWADRAGWPFFRVNPLPQLVLPSRVAWRAPFLDVTLADGRVVALDLDLALLPDVRTWVESASRATLRAALDYLDRRGAPGEAPAGWLTSLAARLRSPRAAADACAS